MKHQCQLKQIINFKYEIQSTNQIYHHSLNSLTSYNHHTTTPHNHTYTHITYHQPLSEHIGGQSDWKEIKNKQSNGQSKHNSNLLKYEKTLLIQEQAKSAQHLEQTGPKIQDKFSTPRKNRTSQPKLILSATPKKKQLLETPQSKSNFNRKGLALISSLIQEVLQTTYTHSKRFTCAEISSCVLDQFCRRAEMENNTGLIDQKQRKTIKRRVYDSINVLIALGKIKKDHKWLYVQTVGGSVGEEIVIAKKQKVANLSKDLAQKQELLSMAKRQYQKLKQLKQRNQGLTQSKQLAQATVSTQNGHTYYRFPLILISTDVHQQSQLTVELQSNQGNKQLVSVSGQRLNIISELTALDLINIEHGRNHHSHIASFE